MDHYALFGFAVHGCSNNMDDAWDNNNVHFGWCRDGDDVHVHVPRPAPVGRPGGLRRVSSISAGLSEAGRTREDGDSIGSGAGSGAGGSQEEQTQSAGSSGVSLQ